MQYTATLSYLLYAASIVLAAPVVDKRQFGGLGGSGGGSTRNDIKDGKCAPVTLIFARGSTEPGNFGSSVGPALASALQSQLGDDGVAIQGVDYEASIGSNALMGSEGGPVMADLVKQALSSCPDTKIALSGYSQGGFVVSNAISSGGVSPDDIAAAVVYGDPSRQTAGGLDESKVKSYCASGDGVCETGTFAISAAHLAYTSNGDCDDGAQFIVSKTKGGSASSSSSSSGSSDSGSSTASASPSSTSSSSSSSSSGSSGSSSGSSGLGSLGSLSGFGTRKGSSSSGSGLGSLGSLGGGSGSSGLGSLGSLGSLGGGSSGSSGSSGLGSLGSLGGGSGSSGLGSLGSLGGSGSGSKLGSFSKN